MTEENFQFYQRTKICSLRNDLLRSTWHDQTNYNEYYETFSLLLCVPLEMAKPRSATNVVKALIYQRCGSFMSWERQHQTRFQKGKFHSGNLLYCSPVVGVSSIFVVNDLLHDDCVNYGWITSFYLAFSLHFLCQSYRIYISYGRFVRYSSFLS